MSVFTELPYKLVDAGFDINLRKGDGDFAYEIYTGAKSNLTISPSNTYLCEYKDRYSSGICEDYDDFLITLKSCLCGKDYAN